MKTGYFITREFYQKRIEFYKATDRYDEDFRKRRIKYLTEQMYMARPIVEDAVQKSK